MQIYPEGDNMEKLAQTGDFRPNAAYPDNGKLQSDAAQANLNKIGKTPRRVLLEKCKTCGKTYAETTGTIFYRKHAQEHEILEVLTLLAEGNRISALTRVIVIKEDTILRWL